jgi:hypothetical protein
MVRLQFDSHNRETCSIRIFQRQKQIEDARNLFGIQEFYDRYLSFKSHGIHYIDGVQVLQKFVCYRIN